MPKKIDAAVKQRALRMFADHRRDDPSETALAEAVAKTVGVGRDTARRLAQGAGMAAVAAFSHDHLDTGSAPAPAPAGVRHRR